MNSISLEWKTTEPLTVLVMGNTEAKFGEVDSKDYKVGDAIAGGGKVLFVGTETEFIHSGLEENLLCYYRLYTKRDNGWLLSGEISAKTELGVIRRFPYVEDFETAKLGSAWRIESIYPNSMGCEITEYYNGGGWCLMTVFETIPIHQKTRIIMPPIDFSGKKCAALSFNQVNNMEEMLVQYRNSPTAEWKTIKTIGTTYGELKFNIMASQKRMVAVELPHLSSTYEISFVTEFSRHNQTTGIEERTAIDDIRIDCDDYAYAFTGDMTPVADQIADVSIEVVASNPSTVKQGIQWSSRNPNEPSFAYGTGWCDVVFAEPGTKRVTQLPSLNVKTNPWHVVSVYYRAFVEKSNGERTYGQLKNGNVYVGLSNGKGTTEDPFRISTNEELREFMKANDHCNFKGMCVSIEKDLELPTDIKYVTSSFNGIFEGNGHTLTGDIKLFGGVGESGIVKNISLVCKSDTLINLCNNNHGRIENCKVLICDTIYIFPNSLSERDYGGICTTNYGSIINCHTEFSAKSDKFKCGGICSRNYGYISDCSFRGYVASNNNSNIGGIAGLNWDSNINKRNVCGIIKNCVNYGCFELYETQSTPNSVNVGGICGSNYGTIEECENNGTIFAYKNGLLFETMCGGISGYASQYSLVKNCVNYGGLTNQESGDLHYCGGIIGFSHFGIMENNVNYGDIKVIGDDEGLYHPSIALENNSDAHNNYYDCCVGYEKKINITTVQ